jgi:predicted DNA-binding transcriptional regulator AlpA
MAKTTTWAVELTVQQPIPNSQEWPDRLEEDLRNGGAESASVTTSQQLDGYNARIWIQAPTAGTAVAAAERLVATPGQVVRAEAMTEGEFERDLSRPSLPELVGPQEMAAQLSISRQRLYEVIRMPNFPRPILELAVGPIWLSESVNHFVANWARKPGRPRKDVEPTVAVIANGRKFSTAPQEGKPRRATAKSAAPSMKAPKARISTRTAHERTRRSTSSARRSAGSQVVDQAEAS